MTCRTSHALGGPVGWLAILALVAGCAPSVTDCPRCDTLVIAAIGEPDHLLPPFVWQSVGRDIDDLVFDRLAVLDPSRSPLDLGGYRPALAERWERIDSVAWRFHLRSAAWGDGRPVTAADVVFSFEAHQDPELDAVARGSLEGLRAVAEDSATVRIQFDRPRPDQLYDATYHVRIFPRHLWDSIPRDRWGAASEPARLVGSGQYRVVEWQRGQFLVLEATGADPPPIRRVIWRFVGAPDAASNLIITGEADLLETIPDPVRRPEFERLTDYRVQVYPSSVYGFLGFNLRQENRLSDVRVRRALELALDRETLALAVFGAGTTVPDGPMSPQLWLWQAPAPAVADTSRAASLLDEAGWPRSAGGERRRNGRPLAVDILVPGTSATRRNMAIAIQERWSRLGIAATVSSVDFPVFQERLENGRFETFIGAWLDEPHPRSLADQWTRTGWDRQNYGHYANPAFDSLFSAAMAEPDPATTRRLWREALAILNQDVPAIWLYSPGNAAVVHRRLVPPTEFKPFAWLTGLPGWRLSAPLDRGAMPDGSHPDR